MKFTSAYGNDITLAKCAKTGNPFCLHLSDASDAKPSHAPKKHPKIQIPNRDQIPKVAQIGCLFRLGFGIFLDFGIWILGFLPCPTRLPKLFPTTVFHLISKKLTPPVSYKQNTMSYCVQI